MCKMPRCIRSRPLRRRNYFVKRKTMRRRAPPPHKKAPRDQPISGGYSLPKKPRRVCRPQAANKWNHFLRRRVRRKKTLLSLQVWNLFAFSEQIMRAADCKPFGTVSRHPARGVVSFYLNTFLYTKQLKIYIKLTLKNCRILPLARSKSEVYSMECNFSADNFTKPMRTPEKVNFFRV